LNSPPVLTRNLSRAQDAPSKCVSAHVRVGSE
jgi:hypothetical protein